MFRDMRRKDRALSQAEAWDIIKRGKFGVLAVSGEEGYPYGVPMHYIVMGEKIYFHGTVEGGHKDAAMAQNLKVSFTVIEPLEGAKAQSTIIFGTASIVLDMRETVLAKIVEKYVPEFAWEQAKAGIPFAKDGIHAYELRVDHITGKWVDKPEVR